MEDRIRNIENLVELSAALAQESAALVERLYASQQRMADNYQRIAENQRRIAENLQSVEESHHLLAASQSRRDELLQQMLQAVAVMQAEIVRIDQTHS